MRKTVLGALAFGTVVGCSGGSGGDKPDRDVIVGVVSGPVTETGEQASFTVVLRARPSRDVTIPVSSSNEAEGTVSPAALTFTRDDWDAPQTVLVTGVDDAQKDGNATFTAVLGAATSADAAYGGVDAPDVLVTNLDDETAGVRVSEISGQTTELGTTATFTVVLQSRPISNVLLFFGTSALDEGLTDITDLTFTPDDWDAPRTITVTGQNDAEADGAQNYAVLFTSAFSDDPDYAFLPVDAVPVTNLDDDTAGILVSKDSGTTSEVLHEETFTVRLLSKPAATVTLTWTLSDTTEGSFTSTTATTLVQQFTIFTWDVPQTFTIRGDNDTIADGDQPYNVAVTSIGGTDADYTSLAKPRINLVNVDDDIAGFIVSPPSGPTSESGLTSTFTVSLRAAATGPVAIDLGTTLPSEATVSPATLSLSTTTPQTVTVKGKVDFRRDGHKPFAITFSPAVSTDAAYDGRQIPNVGLTNIDDGPIRKLLVYDDANGSEADDAGTIAGFTVLTASDPASFDALLDAGDVELVVFESTAAALPPSTESRLVAWVTSGGKIVFSHWDLASHPALESAFEVDASPFTSNNRLFLPSTGVNVNLFDGVADFPAPLVGDALVGDVANELALLTTAGELACRFDDPATGPGAIAITHGGKVVVNGFSPDDVAGVDAEPGSPSGDGVPDLRELYQNALALLASASGSGGTSRFDSNTPTATVTGTGRTSPGIVTTPPLLVAGGPSSIGTMRVSMFFQTTDDFNDFSEINLISPTGVVVGLSIHNSSASPNSGNSNYGLSCDDASRTIFDDAAAISIDLPTLPPFVGPHRPTEPLAGFNGLDANGEWKIEIVNDWSSDSGTLQCWSLHFD